MVSVRVQQRVSLSDDQAQRAWLLERHLGDLLSELKTTLDALHDCGFDASISVSDDGAAPGN